MTILPPEDGDVVYGLARAVADSGDFQKAVQKDSADGALDHVHYPYVDLDGDDYGILMKPPRCIIADEPGDMEYVIVGVGSFKLRQSVWISFDLVIPEDVASEGSHVNNWRWFRKTIKAIMSHIQEIGKTGQAFGLRAYPEIEFAKVNGPHEKDYSESGAIQDPELGQDPKIWHIAFLATFEPGTS